MLKLVKVTMKTAEIVEAVGEETNAGEYYRSQDIRRMKNW